MKIRTWGFIFMIPIVLLMGTIYFHTNSITVRHYRIQDISLGKVLGGLKIAHLSDLHLRAQGAMERRVIDILKEEKPDLVFLTGDYIRHMGSYEPAVRFLEELRAPLGSYAVLGNTDYSNENGSCILCHAEKSTVRKKNPHPVFLRNSSTRLEHRGKGIHLVGLDDPVLKKDDFEEALQGIKSEEPVILLAHSPEIFEDAVQRGVDLVLCGHNHGGQIWGARFLQKVFPYDSTLEIPAGLHQKGKTLMHVSPGIGVSHLPFRLGVEPEITFLTFSEPPDPSHGDSRQVLNSSSRKSWSGFSAADLYQTFNFLPSPDGPAPISPIHSDGDMLFDFESEEDLLKLNWECRKWFERSLQGATSGRYSLRITLPPGQYPGIHFQGFREDWSGRSALALDVLNPSKEELVFHLRIDDAKSGAEYADRFDCNFRLKPGMNSLSIPMHSLKTNRTGRSLDIRRIKKMIVFIPHNREKRTIHLDGIRLE